MGFVREDKSDAKFIQAFAIYFLLTIFVLSNETETSNAVEQLVRDSLTCTKCITVIVVWQSFFYIFW
jgi:hypothetical protein